MLFYCHAISTCLHPRIPTERLTHVDSPKLFDGFKGDNLFEQVIPVVTLGRWLAKLTQKQHLQTVGY